MKLKNTLTRKIEEFVPLREKEVGIYLCGLTVYDRMHIGHIRSFIPFDILVRYFKYKGYKVTFVRNFTDVDDKIINRALQEGKTAQEIAETYIKLFYEDISHFELAKPDFEPRVTENIQEIIELIQKIIRNGYAYVSDGDVYFEVDKFKDYGKLSGMSKDDMLAGARVEVSEKKRNPLDFALWKQKKYDYEPSWKSPWGEGRPGWHIECSAMSMKYLGETFDIHGGGQDLIFPHHENEIAQSESATQKTFVRYWLHAGHLFIGGEKMSKSLGNIITVPQILNMFHPEVLKLFIIKSHYRSNIEISGIEDIKKEEKTLVNFYYNIEFLVDKLKINHEEINKVEPDESAVSNFEKALEEDMNTPEAISIIFSEYDKAIREGSKYTFLKFLKFLNVASDILGVFGRIQVLGRTSFIEDEIRRRCEQKGYNYEEICSLIEKRNELRKEKRFQEADEIRRKIMEIGIYLQDTELGSRKIPV
ncbi:MAG: cysteine--tRNA ligase [Candidatus Calescibacterium sp.]|nr:cysteine--tRNA ligase [Candidatus Calescibacterium sp.]MCX7733679.1 cysteine--tRNA ligase [bacterium]MDW8087876.1 cysteine--tRNA ligase [Candidatus Calescibacterium sp.]